MSELRLEARGLHRFYRRGDQEVAALRDVDLRLAPGEMVAVMGRSGSGKTTLLRLLSGLEPPDGGQVYLAGALLSHRPVSEQSRLRRRHLGTMTQASGLIDHLDVLGNLRLAASFRLAPRPGDAALRDLLDDVGLGDRASARPATLSGGETARANLAVALVGGPSVLLADEPTAEVSTSEERRLLALLRRLQGDGAALVVTHSAVVAGAADRQARLVDGRLS